MEKKRTYHLRCEAHITSDKDSPEEAPFGTPMSGPLNEGYLTGACALNTLIEAAKNNGLNGRSIHNKNPQIVCVWHHSKSTAGQNCGAEYSIDLPS